MRRDIRLLVVVALSILVRIAYFVQASHGPLLALNRWDQSDMAFFDEWARLVAGGDWLTDRALHPQHYWHQDISRAYLERHPEALSGLDSRQALPPTEASAALWDRWYGGKTFHQEPLYPYLVAIVYRLFGEDMRIVFGLQLGLGILTNVLVYLIACRLFAPPVPLLAGFLAVLYSPLLFYEMVLLRESTIVLAGLALVWLVLKARDADRPGAWGLVGFAFGLSLLLRGSFLLMFALILAVLVHRPRPTWSATARKFVACMGGAGLALLPLVARNLAVGVAPLALSSVGPVTFVNANTVDYPPEVGFFVSLDHAPEIMGASEGKFLPAARAALLTHPSAWSVLAQVLRKLSGAWNAYEAPENCNFFLYRLHAGILGLPVTFAVVGPLALVGLLLTCRSPRQTWPLLFLLLTSLATMLIFYPSSRFRAPLAAACIPYAAFALVLFGRLLAARRTGAAGALGAALLAAVAWTGHPLVPDRSPLRAVDCSLPYTLYYEPRMKEAWARRDWASVAAEMEEEVRFEPDFVRETRIPTNPDAYRCLEVSLAAHANAAYALRREGCLERVLAHERQTSAIEAALAAAHAKASPRNPGLR